VSERIFNRGPCLFGVALELIDASLGAQPGVPGGAAEVLLGRALGGLGLWAIFLPMLMADSLGFR